MGAGSALRQRRTLASDTRKHRATCFLIEKLHFDLCAKVRKLVGGADFSAKTPQVTQNKR
jgi:hypothetical protein